MPRFAFGKRRSTAEGENEVAPPSFRVLDRSEVSEGNGKTFDGGARLSAKQQTLPRTTVSDLTYEDDLFADFKPNTNRGSGSSNTTKTNSTDNSSRHSNASTTPSSADLNGHEDWKLNKKSHTEVIAPPTSRPTSFLKSGRSWSFGGSKKHQPPAPVGEEDIPDTPAVPAEYKTGRARATTASTDATITPPHQDQDFGLDLGGSFSKMLLGFDKRNSVMSMRAENGREVLQPSAMTGGRVNAPSPIHIDRSSNVEPPQHSWASHRSNEDLLGANENTPPPVPKHTETLPVRPRGTNTTSSDSILKRTSAMFGGRRKSAMVPDNDGEGDDLNSSLLAVSRFMSDTNSRSTTPVEAIGGRQRKNDDASAGYTIVPRRSPPTKDDFDEDDNLFDNIPLNSERLNTPRQPKRKAPEVPAQTKVMTPSEFEKYRKDKEVESRRAAVDKIRDNVPDDEDEDEDNYEDDEDEAEKARQLAKQRRKQEAHMSVYRQQMMKVTGDSEPRPPMVASYSTPNLTVPDFSRNTSSTTSDAEDDEEVPLAILAAHGFPNKNRPPTRLNNMMSNPNLRQAAQPSYQRPSSAAGQMPPGGGGLPPFARGLPTDPYGLVNPTVRESFALGGGMPAGHNPPMSPAGPATNHVGLVGVIASEERARSMRRGSPQVHQSDGFQGSQAMGPGGFDPMQGIPHQMMYPQAMQAQMQQMQQMQMQNMMSPGEQAQIHLSQQMSQFMQMQMQFMQMMAGNNSAGLDPPRSAGHMSSQSLGQFGEMNGMNPGARGSFLELPGMDARGDGRTMSMVQPNSTSWLQPPSVPGAGYAGSIRGQGYAPSIAPSERSNVGLPGRYRPVSHMPPPASTTPDQTRKSFIPGGLSPLGGSKTPKASDRSQNKRVSTKEEADDDDDEGWAAMKAKRDQKKSSWRIRKTIAPGDLDIGSLIT